MITQHPVCGWSGTVPSGQATGVCAACGLTRSRREVQRCQISGPVVGTQSPKARLLRTNATAKAAGSCCGRSELAVSRPSVVKQGLSYAAALTKFVGDGLQTRSETEQAENLSICGGCPLLGADGKCDGCGCVVADKVKMRLEECPAGKWLADLHEVRPLVNWTRNLCYFILPVEKSPLWKWNLDQLARRPDAFNGKQVLAIAYEPKDVGKDGGSLKTVKPDEVLRYSELVGLRWDSYRIFPNSRQLGEVVGFQWLLEQVSSIDPNTTTAYMHAKGVRHWNDPNSEPTVKRWAEWMYHALLDDPETLHRALERYSVAGTFLRDYPSGKHQYHYSGTFFEGRNDDWFSRNWQAVRQTYYGTEWYPADVFERHEACSLSHYNTPSLSQVGGLYLTAEWDRMERSSQVYEVARQNLPTATEIPPVISPLRDAPLEWKPWEGSRPWEGHRVTAIIPTLEWSPLLELAVESLLLQTERPLIMIVDTGSVETTPQLQAMRRRNRVEVISIPSQGWIHPSEPVASAIEAAWSMVHTPYAYLTHNDCIVKRKDLLADMVEMAKKHKATGYRITERPYPEWTTELGHTCLMLDVAEMDRIGMAWNLRAFATVTGQSLDPEVCGPNVVDTERFMNLKLRQAGIVPHFIGDELNYERTNDENIDHCRSRTSGLLYSPQHSLKAEKWEADAIIAAKERHAKWAADRTDV